MKSLETWNPKATTLLQKSILQCLKLLITEEKTQDKQNCYYEFLNEFLKSFPNLIISEQEGQEIWPFLTDLIQVPILSRIPKQSFRWEAFITHKVMFLQDLTGFSPFTFCQSTP